MGRLISLGLVGYPLEHSLSPAMHSAALKAMGLEGEYKLFPIPPLPGGRPAIIDLLTQVREGGLQGLNVTIPHKQTLLPLLEGLTPMAESIAAANTIFMRSGELLGDNTDAPGFVQDLNRLLAGQSPSSSEISLVAEEHALILGSGGGAQAVAYALCKKGWQVTLAGRRFSRPGKWAVGDHHVNAIPFMRSALIELQPVIRLLVNATPLGMWPAVENDPWPGDIPLPDGALVYDLVYNPPETALMRRAREQGLAAYNGLGMLVEQAALSLECWTGQDVPRQAMREAVER